MEILTVKQAADRLKISREAVYQAIRRGVFSPVTLLGKTGLPIAQVEEFKQARAKNKKK